VAPDGRTRKVNDQVDDELVDLLASTVGSLGLELVGVDQRPAMIRVVVDRTGGADVDLIAEATRAVSAALDRHDPFPDRRYTLEVTSPGVERPLRSPRDFVRAVGETVTVRTRSGGEGERRFTGRLAEADEAGFVVEGTQDGGPGATEGVVTRGPDDASGRRFAYEDIERARTVFEWGPSTPPARRGRPSRARASAGKVARP
jgi:ribosome maturation factor RimP